jgi:hypothetical protein
MKTAAILFVIAIILFQITLADVFSQLQFMKIISPTNGQSITAGEQVTIKYAMQPLVYSKLYLFSYTQWII